VYQWNFVRNLKRRMRRKAALFPGRFDLGPLARVRSVRGFDEAYTAPHHGFRDADDYYFKASALRVVSRIAIPALIVASDNDPFVPVEQFRRPDVAGNAHVTVAITRDGGHCAFVAEQPDGYDGYWAEQAAIAFHARHAKSELDPVPGDATSSRGIRVESASISRFAKSGPFPSSSCLK
jgi:predicted alpha/beta-fold hydrolase